MGNAIKNTEPFVLEMSMNEESYEFASSIEMAISFAKNEIEKLNETVASLKSLEPDCDKLDYALAASTGVLSGVFDVFIVGKPGISHAEKATDKWVENRVVDFAQFCGWSGKEDTSSAIRYLERKFKVPYDQRGAGDAGSEVFGLNPVNHHFKSLGHNPTLLGLFCSIVDQFTNQSHFITDGQLISLQEADGKFKLCGENFPAKLFCGFANWFGHLISDMSGASSSKGRGMGIPSPVWAWTNDIIAIKSKLNIPVSEFNKTVNELALKIYEKGYDVRFQLAQIIPVFINETVVRLLYSTRRLIKYLLTTERENRSISDIWKVCNPFSNPTVKRMLTVAHGTFCMVDVVDATIRAFLSEDIIFDPAEFFLRLNVVGVGRFMISLYGEAKQVSETQTIKAETKFAQREIIIVENYLDGLALLSELYNDKELLKFTNDFKTSNLYIQAFEKSICLAKLRKVPNNKILKTKTEIDSYFRGE